MDNLKEKILEKESENINYDKSIYMQGAIWIIDKLIKEI